MTAKAMMFSESSRQRVARHVDLAPNPARLRLSPRRRTWRARLAEARNILSFVLLAAVFAWRSSVSWRRWQQRGRRSRGD